MKRMYEKPAAYEEAFMANEYVAACYALACRVGSDGHIPKYIYSGRRQYKNPNYLWQVDEKGDDITHAVLNTSGTCADKHANRVITDDGGIFQQVQEYNSAVGGQGWINGGYDGYIDVDKSGTMNTGDIVYWHTTNSYGNRIWNHYGTLEAADSNHPNHS